MYTKQYVLMLGLAFFVLTLFFAFYLSPQLSFWGRGLRTLLPLFAVAAAISLINIPLPRLFENRYIVPIACAIAFFLNGYLHHWAEPRPTALSNLLLPSLYCLMAYVAVLSAKLVFPPILEPVRWTVLFIFGIALLLGLPAQLQDPIAARFRSTANPGSYAGLGAQGVASFTTYTAIAIAWPGIANWLYRSQTPLLLRLLGWGALAVLSVSTLVSTFSMALLILVIGILGFILLGVPTAKNTGYRVLFLLMCIIVLLTAPIIYNASVESEYLSFSTSKLTRLITDTFSVGLVRADTTTRVQRIQASLESFTESPIIGTWGVTERAYSGGHSAFFDILSLLGVTGLVLWIGFLSPYLWRRNRSPLNISNGLGGSTLSWLLYLLSGLMNPTWLRVEIIILLCLFDDINTHKSCQHIED